MKVFWGAATSIALMAVVLSGCSTDSNDNKPSGGTPNASAGAPAPAQNGKPWQDEIAAATSAGKVGNTGSPCALPVTMDLAKAWLPKAVDTRSTGSPLDALSHQASFAVACEIDAKPAGNLGFIRIWTGGTPTTTPRQALDEFLAADKNLSEQQFRETSAGGLAAAEVTYLRYTPILESSKTERILAVATPKGPVLVVLGGFDSDEHTGMLPAYVLAKQSMKVTA